MNSALHPHVPASKQMALGSAQSPFVPSLGVQGVPNVCTGTAGKA